MDGAIDMVSCTQNFILAMIQANIKGESKILKKCSLPLTDVGCVKKVVTELAVMEVASEGFKLLERAPRVSIEHIIASTEASVVIEGDILEMNIN
jgi:3-oxoacid CoA-transferase subunit B